MIKTKLTVCMCMILAVVFVKALAHQDSFLLVAHSKFPTTVIANAQNKLALQTKHESKSTHTKAAKTIIENSCLSCHGAAQMSGLDLRERETALKGGARGPALVPGKAEESLLYLTVAGKHEVQMPPGKQKLSVEEIKTLHDWINEGAAWDDQEQKRASSSVEHAAMGVLTQNCYACHAAAQTSGLDLRQRETALKGGTRGPAIVPGKPEESLLYQAITRTGELKMPPGKAGLSEGDIKILHDWIKAGAQWPAGDVHAQTRTEASWWSFKKPTRPEVPAPKDAGWVRNPVDAFILHKLEEKKLKPAPPADKQTLVRRAYFDLLGLPPTPGQVKSFVEDQSPNAYEKLIDQLLASPRYGERWGRHWLDVVRYADTGGFENDLYYKNAWRYRDYVIKSFNDDKPYDQFVQEQIAADEIWPNNLELEGTYDVPKQKQIDLERRIGTSLYTIGPYLPAAGLIGDYLRAEKLADMADVTSAAFLGMTMSCARCHDHKFDPIPQKDYYRLQAVFAASEEKEIPMVDVMKIFDHQKAVTKLVTIDDIKASLAKFDEQTSRRRLEAQLPKEVVEAYKVAPELRSQKEKGLAEQYESSITAAEVKKLLKAQKIELTGSEKQEREQLVKRLVETVMEAPVQYATASVLGHVEDIPDVHVAVRGDYKNKGAKVGPGFPSAISDGKDLEDPKVSPYKTRRRKDFALWLTEPSHPLTTRVMVNRIWQGHFGWGIVRSSNDFGRQGEPPTHPELLDWLATEFVARKWSVKQMHRLLMLSNTYQMSNRHDESNARIDGDNRYLWRMNRRRLEAEAVRDAVLAVAGNLNLKVGGVPIVTTLNQDEMDGVKNLYQWNPTVDPAEYNRRGVYLYVKRGFRYPFFEIFDSPDSSFSCPRRDVTNVAPQALALLNNDFVFNQSEILAARLKREHGVNPSLWVEYGWELALGRKPNEAEKQKSLEMFAPPTAKNRAHQIKAKFSSRESDPDIDAALIRFCLMLFNLNEFIYVD